jgi:cbb3-type cytochrome oxidase subunit 3
VIAAVDPVLTMASAQGGPAVFGIASTLLFVAAYVGWAVWAYAPSRRAVMEDCGRIPFDEDLPGGDA